MNVLVTGGAGFIGSHLSEELLKRGHQVFIIDDLSSGSIENVIHLKENPRFHYSIDNIMNEPVLAELIDRCDLVFHLAASVGVKMIIDRPIETIETNILGTSKVLSVASKKGKKVLITSTSETYGKSTKASFKEGDDMILGPTNMSRWSYACSKAIDEFLSLAYYKERKLPVVIVRIFNTIGPRQTGRYGMVIPTFIKQALYDQPITVYGTGKQSRCFAHVKDTVKALIELADKEEAVGRIFNVGTTEEISIEDLAKMVKDLAGSESEITYIPYERAYEKGFEDMMRRSPDTTELKKILGWVPSTSLKETLEDSIKHMKDALDVK